MTYPNPDNFTFEKDDLYNNFLHTFNQQSIERIATEAKENPENILKHDDKSINAFYVWFTMKHTNMNQKESCECFHVTSRHYRDVSKKQENIEEWTTLGDDLYNEINKENDELMYRD